MQVSVPSISKARQVTNAQPQLKSILVGGKRYAPLTTDDLQRVFALLDYEPETIAENVGGVFVRSIYLPQHGPNGTLYRLGEFCLVSNSAGGQTVLKISEIFAVSINNTYSSFIKGCQYAPDSVNPMTHSHSGNPVVADVHCNLICTDSQLERKLMLYPHQTVPNHFIVMDHNRPSIPLKSIRCNSTNLARKT